jgi:hypothetical protein
MRKCCQFNFYNDLPAVKNELYLKFQNRQTAFRKFYIDSREFIPGRDRGDSVISNPQPNTFYYYELKTTSFHVPIMRFS